MCPIMSGLLRQEPGFSLEGLLQLVRKRKTGLHVSASRRKMPGYKHLSSTNFTLIKLLSLFINYLDLMIVCRNS
jgi:hypothetical protein